MPAPELRTNYYDGLKDCPTMKGVSGSITTTGTITVWTPSSSALKFRLRYVALGLTVTTVLAGTGVALSLYDGSVSAGTLIWTVYTCAANAAAGTVLVPTAIQLPTPGIKSATANNALILSFDATISTGVVKIYGAVGGIEES